MTLFNERFQRICSSCCRHQQFANESETAKRPTGIVTPDRKKDLFMNSGDTINLRMFDTASGRVHAEGELVQGDQVVVPSL